MNSQQKKIRMDRNASLDPLQLENEKIYALILQHLSGSDVLNLSEVSHEWYQLIACSEDEIKKFHLEIAEGWDREFDIEDVENSSRRYNSVKVKRLFRQRDHIPPMFVYLADFLVSIDTVFDFDMKGIQLPNVRSLRMRTTSVSSIIEDGLLGAVTNLTKLELSGPKFNWSKVISCLEANAGLVELSLENEVPEEIFKTLDHSIEAQLQVFKVDKANFSHCIHVNLLKFLAHHLLSLVELKILRCDVYVFNDIFNGLTNLRSLTYSPAVYSSFHGFELKDHPKLEELNLVCISPPILQHILPCVPHLKKLYISDPTIQMFRFVLFKAPCLREFKYAFVRDTIDNECLSKVYEVEKLNNYDGFNHHIAAIKQI